MALPSAAPSHARAIRLWLLAIAGLLAAMVLVGGATRLTESGLSIVEWQPVTGALPPLSADAWQAEFDKYRATPQYRHLNAGMSLDEIPTILDLIEGIKQETHKTVLLVEHRMDVVTRLADRIIVLQDGMLIADGAPAEVVALPVVQQAYLGVQQNAAVRGEALQ